MDPHTNHPPITLVSKKLRGQLESVLGSHRIVSGALPPHPAGFKQGLQSCNQMSIRSIHHFENAQHNSALSNSGSLSLVFPLSVSQYPYYKTLKPGMKNEERLKQVQRVQCSVPTSMSCILLCETRAKVCCKAGSMRPLLGGAAGSNLQALAETTRHRKHTKACQLYLGPLCPLCIAINSDDLQHPTGVNTVDGRNPAPPGMYKTLQIMGNLSYQLVLDFFIICKVLYIPGGAGFLPSNSSVCIEIWDQGNRPKCPLPGTHNIQAHFTKIILRNLSISNR